MPPCRSVHIVALGYAYVGQQHLLHAGGQGPLHEKVLFFPGEGFVGAVGMGVDKGHNVQSYDFLSLMVHRPIRSRQMNPSEVPA